LTPLANSGSPAVERVSGFVTGIISPKLLAGLVAFSLFVNLLLLVPALYMMQVYDRVLSSRSESTLAVLSLGLLIAVGLLGCMERARQVVASRLGDLVHEALHPRVHAALYAQNLRDGGANPAQAVGDLLAIRQFFASAAPMALFDALWLPLFLGVVFVLAPALGWFAVGGAVVLIMLTVIGERFNLGLAREASEQTGRLQARINGDLRQAEVMRAMGMHDSIMARWQTLQAPITDLYARLAERAATHGAIARFVRSAMQSLVLGLGALIALRHEFSPGAMIAGSILVGRALAPLDQIIASWRAFESAHAAFRRLSALLEGYAPPLAVMELPPPTGAVRFENVSVTPPRSGAPSLVELSLDVEAGQHVGLVGPSGAGKSSFARALVGVWPASAGCIRLAGAELSRWDPARLGPHVGYLPQDVQLFAGTIAENIARFAPVESERVIAAAQAAGIHDLVLAMPAAYDTVLGEGGAGLSGGQRQRIGLARALYGWPTLVVLDEPNANLDEAGELALAAALRELKRRGATVFVITHRVNLLEQVDRIVVLVDGRVQRAGPRSEMLQQLRPANAIRRA